MGASGFHGEIAPAAHSLKKREMCILLAELDTNEEFWPSLIHRITDGEFISEVAKNLGVTHSVLRMWIHGNKARDKEYIAAELLGRKARTDRVLQKTYELAVADNDTPPTRMEQLRAAEILLKQTPEQPAPSTIANIAITFVAAQDGREKVINPE